MMILIQRMNARFKHASVEDLRGYVLHISEAATEYLCSCMQFLCFLCNSVFEIFPKEVITSCTPQHSKQLCSESVFVLLYPMAITPFNCQSSLWVSNVKHTVLCTLNMFLVHYSTIGATFSCQFTRISRTFTINCQ